MIDKFKQLGKDSIIYGITGVAASFVGILLLPVLTKNLSTGEYGVIDLTTTLITILTIILTFGFDTSTSIYFFETKNDLEKSKIISTSYLFIFIVSLVICIFLTIFKEQISQLIFNSKNQTQYIYLALITIPFSVTYSMALRCLRLYFSSIKYATATILKILLTLLFAYFLIVILKKGISGYFYALLISTFLSFVVTSFLAKRGIALSFSKKILKKLIKTGAPLILAGIFAWILSVIDRFFLLRYSDLSTVGIYSVGVKISSIITLFITAFRLAWGPFSLSVAKENDASKFYSKVLTNFVLVCSFFLLALSLFSQEIISIVSTPEYLSATSVIALLSTGMIFYGMYYIISIAINIKKKTSFIALTTLIAAIVNICLNFLLIPSFQMIGAAIATLISYAISTIVLFIIAQRIYRVNYEVTKIIWILVPTFLVSQFILLTFNYIPYNLLFKSLILLAFLILYWFSVFSKKERSRLTSLILK